MKVIKRAIATWMELSPGERALVNEKSVKARDAREMSMSPDQTKEQLEGIANILGVDPNNEEELRNAFEALFAPIEAERQKARARLSPRERELVQERGADPAKYIAVRNAIKQKSRQ